MKSHVEKIPIYIRKQILKIFRLVRGRLLHSGFYTPDFDHRFWTHCVELIIHITANGSIIDVFLCCSGKRVGTEQFRKVVRFVRHYNFNPDPLLKDSDIALLELNHEATLNKNVGIACLPTAPPKPEDSLCYITGMPYDVIFSKGSNL